MRGIVFNLLVLLLVSTIIAAGTLATFKDKETSEQNIFSAGTLDLKVDEKETPNLPVYFNASNIKPGDYGCVDISVENIGSINGILYVYITNVSYMDIIDNDAEEEATIKYGAPPDALGYFLVLNFTYNENFLYSIPLRFLENMPAKIGYLNSGETSNLTICYQFAKPGDCFIAPDGSQYCYDDIPTDTWNAVQGDEVRFDLVFELSSSELPPPVPGG